MRSGRNRVFIALDERLSPVSILSQASKRQFVRNRLPGPPVITEMVVWPGRIFGILPDSGLLINRLFGY